MKERDEAERMHNSVVKIRMNADEKKRLKTEARNAGITLSELFRRRTANIHIFAKTDMAMLSELRRIGGLLKLVHIESGGAYSQTTRNMLSELQSVIRRIGNDNKAD